MTERQPLDYAIREASPTDMPAIDAINRRTWTGGITTHQLLEQRHGRLNDIAWTDSITAAVRAHLAQADVTTFVAEHDGAVIGFAAAQIDPDERPDSGIVSYNAVAPEFQGYGVGTALITRVIDHLVAQGAQVLTLVTLEGDTPAMRLYERLGFRKLTSLVYLTRDAERDT